MANLSLGEIPTKETLSKSDILNMEIIHGKFSLSYKSSLSSFSNFFLSADDLTKMQGSIDNYCMWLDDLVFGGLEDCLMSKESMDIKFMQLSEAKYFYRRLLTDDVMDDLCTEYAQTKYLSSLIDNCREYAQSRATSLANALAQDAAMVKSKAIMNDTNIQLESLRVDTLLDAAEHIADSISTSDE